MIREEAIEKLKSYDPMSMMPALQMAIKALEEPQWIPCSERLPEEGREVLTCLTDWKTGEQRRVVSYRIDFNMWHGYGRYNEKCVAWMPMPEPWRGDAE